MLRFDGKVALITGAGSGLGRTHALLLASRGAKVVVNDLNTSVDENGLAHSAAAAQVVEEIVAAGGVAVAHADTIATYAGGKAAVDRALDAFGDLDIIIHNAGFVDHALFEELDEHRYQRLIDVHLGGGFNVVHPAWRHFKAKRSGQIVLTTSGVGFFGLENHSVYGGAKLGLIGLMHTLAVEGAPYNIRVNALAPIAVTPASASSIEGPAPEYLKTDLVSAAVAVLAHQDCPWTGRTLSAGGGRVSEHFIGATKGYFSKELTPEEVSEHLDDISDQTKCLSFETAMREVELDLAWAMAGGPPP
jgi:NAD(P)-dependent dehydrogenase (short-subunit alcohol dehydrogenase family)